MLEVRTDGHCPRTGTKAQLAWWKELPSPGCWSPFCFFLLPVPSASFLVPGSEHSWGWQRELQAGWAGQSITTHNALTEHPCASSTVTVTVQTHSQALPLSTAGRKLMFDSIEELAGLRCLLLCPGLTQIAWWKCQDKARCMKMTDLSPDLSLVHVWALLPHREVPSGQRSVWGLRVGSGLEMPLCSIP